MCSLIFGTDGVNCRGWSELAVLKEDLVEKLDLPSNGTLTDSLGVLGMTGLTVRNDSVFRKQLNC